jgi:hypothetical protein
MCATHRGFKEKSRMDIVALSPPVKTLEFRLGRIFVERQGPGFVRLLERELATGWGDHLGIGVRVIVQDGWGEAEGMYELVDQDGTPTRRPDRETWRQVGRIWFRVLKAQQARLEQQVAR